VKVGGELAWRKLLDSKRVKTRMSNEPNAIQYNDCGFGRRDEEGQMGRIKIRKGRVYTLAYADDIMLLAEDEEGMRSMITRLEGYIEKKRLELNVNKTKIMRFRKGGGKNRKKRLEMDREQD